MIFSLKTKVMSFITVLVIGASLLSAYLSIAASRKSIERELIARGEALTEALARSVDEGLASENLNLIKHIEDIVHTNDVVLTQVFSTLWLGVGSVPGDQLNVPPNPAAVGYFKVHKNEHDHFSLNEGPWVDIYSPVFFDPHDTRVPKVLIGYVRLRITTSQIGAAVSRAIAMNIAAAVLLTLFSLLILNAIIEKFILKPILALHQTMTRHKQGAAFETVPV